MRRLLLISNSTNHGGGYLDHVLAEIDGFLGPVRRLLFVPFALADRDGYVATARTRLAAIGVEVEGLTADAAGHRRLADAEAVFAGGGNTFRLLATLQRSGLLGHLAARAGEGLPYIGSSAGTNLACPTVRTTNDMPIVEPASLRALGLVPFQINPHYLHGNPPGFKGETREERITEFGVLHPRTRVAGLREGTALRVDGAAIRLLGDAECRVFRHGEPPRELGAADDFSFLLRGD